MAQVTAFTAERMKEIEDTTVVGGLVDVNGNLLLTTREGEAIDAGHVKGDKGDQGDQGIDGAPGSLATPAGTITLWGSDVAPANWLICDGSAVSRTTYASLFAVIGTKYGAGDGVNTFNLPNLKGRTPVGKDSAQTEFAALAQIGGEKTHLLTIAEMPSHSHTSKIDISKLRGDTASGNWQYQSNDAGADPTSSTGGGAAHNNLQPYSVVNFIIKVTNGDTPGDSQLTQRVSDLETFTSSSPAGTITIWGGDSAPTNWMLCNGSAISRTTYASLFSAIGTKYGAGDGSTTFNLPDFRGRVPVGKDVADTSLDTVGKSGGLKTHVHYHANPIGLASTNSYVIDPADASQDAFGGKTDFNYIATAAMSGPIGGKQTGSVEIHMQTSSATSSFQPFQIVNYIIKFTNGDTKGDSQLTTRVSALESKPKTIAVLYQLVSSNIVQGINEFVVNLPAGRSMPSADYVINFNVSEFNNRTFGGAAYTPLESCPINATSFRVRISSNWAGTLSGYISYTLTPVQ